MCLFKQALIDEHALYAFRLAKNFSLYRLLLWVTRLIKTAYLLCAAGFPQYGTRSSEDPISEEESRTSGCEKESV